GTCIGRGSFGTVSTAINKTDGEVFAVKSVDLATCLPAQLESLENEITVLRSLKPHPYIVRFLGDGVSKEGATSFRNLHLEYLPEGDVAKHGIDETLLRRYAACLVSALRHVHAQGLVHCDVKARNEVERSEWSAAMARICELATTRGANWETDGWVDVRSHHPSEEERAKIQYSEHNASLNPYDDVADESGEESVYPNRPPGNEDSAAEVPYEVVMILRLLMECMVY
ncbi:unnamed protein product, partial [Brassica rapa subsp. trilocularis]